MNSFFSKGNLIVFGTLIVLFGVCGIIKSCTQETEIRAAVSPLNVELGKAIYYSDSTSGAKSVLWEFGNGDVSKDPKGSYIFTHTGKYKIRLTVDYDKVVSFIVNVNDRKMATEKERVKIIAPSKAMVNERVVFMADGDADSWNWEFGETGIVDSRERNPIYVFSKPGQHEIRLLAGNMEYPITKTIDVVSSDFTITGDPRSEIENDIQEHLQDIIDKKNFNSNYNYILNKYLSKKHGGRGDNTLVLVNNTNENDFYSYCNGLKIMGKAKSTFIESVTMENNPDGSIKRLLINQSSTK
ncbi:MAG: PKD domain-containing protein [Paludibacteraceae bacterium]|nr:PKD domain-containing protein [Paludibacteraceae bacterium]